MLTGPTIYCSFCGKSQLEVRKLIAGPSAWICDECIDLMRWMLDEECPGRVVNAPSPEPYPEQPQAEEQER